MSDAALFYVPKLDTARFVAWGYPYAVVAYTDRGALVAVRRSPYERRQREEGPW